MTIHEKGVKAERDRAILIHSYETMCNEFRLPASKRLTRADMAKMSNKAIYQASKDVYSQASVKQANRLAVKMGLKESPKMKIIKRIKDWFIYTFYDDHFRKGAASAKAK
jgi:hypothetical protein